MSDFSDEDLEKYLPWNEDLKTNLDAIAATRIKNL